MATYFDALTKDQKENIHGIILACRKANITNPFTQAGILSVVSKESLFIPKTEKGYQKTDNSRIRLIFGKYVSDLDEVELTALKQDEKRFFDKIYGGRYGNAANEGWLFRGRGYNQITFKNNYAQASLDTGVDLVMSPDKLNNPDIAALALIGYFKRAISKAPAVISNHYHFTDINSFTGIDDAVKAIYHANAGWGKTFAAIEADKTGGRKKAIERSTGFLDIVKKTV